MDRMSRRDKFLNQVHDKNPLALTSEELLGLLELKYTDLHTDRISFRVVNSFGTCFNIEADVVF